MKMKFLICSFIVCTFFAFSAQLKAQVTPYNIYQIQVGAFRGDIDLSKFKKLEDLGHITTRSIRFGGAPDDGFTRVFLGKYLGEETARKMLELVKKRGYEDAVFDVDDVNLNISVGRFLIYTLQMGAHKKRYNIKRYKDYGEFVLYEDGYYKVCYGLYASADIPEIRSVVIPRIRKKKYRSFPRRFR